jgi:hypothetical protein
LRMRTFLLSALALALSAPGTSHAKRAAPAELSPIEMDAQKFEVVFRKKSCGKSRYAGYQVVVTARDANRFYVKW